MALIASPTSVTFEVGREESVQHRSVPAIGMSAARRIDVSSWQDIMVDFYRLRNVQGKMERTSLGRYCIASGVQLIWPVPEQALMDDVLLDMTLVGEEGGPTCLVHVADHWRTT